MKKLFGLLVAALFLLPQFAKAQSGPPAPSTGIYALIDTNYTVGTYTQGYSTAKVTLQNNTGTKITGVQFRVFYDTSAFSSSSVSLIGSSSNLYLQSVDDSINGNITITLVYTGSSNTYDLPTGERFLLTFNHVSASSFYALPSISDLTWTGVTSFQPYSSAQSGLDTSLTLYSYGGNWIPQQLSFHGRFKNVTGSGAKNLHLALEKKVKTGNTWSSHNTYTTDTSGYFSFTESVDTTYYDVRLAIKGDTMNVGNVISTADAQLINQWVLGSATPSGFDYYTADVNESDNITITDAYGVFGRISGRFSAWPNGTKDIKFFTVSERNTIIGSPSTNHTGTITGVTNFYYNILPGQPDSVTYWVLVPGDANGTGYHMARLTPIEILPNPVPGFPSQTENVIDLNVEYDFPTSSMEVYMPSISVKEGSLVEIPVTVKTNGKSLSALQMSLMYNDSLLEFKGLKNSDKAMFWISSLNPMNDEVEWAGYDPSKEKKYMLPDGYEVFKLQFIALKPQGEWQSAPLYTTRKFSGDAGSKDMSILPTGGIMIVSKMAGPGGNVTTNQMVVYPNPTTGEFYIDFEVLEDSHVQLHINDMNGTPVKVILDRDMPAGSYVYSCNIKNLSEGIYVASLRSKTQNASQKIIKNN